MIICFRTYVQFDQWEHSGCRRFVATIPEKNRSMKDLFFLVGLVGLEPMTPTMSTWCSNQLSYNPKRSAKGIIAQARQNCKDFSPYLAVCLQSFAFQSFQPFLSLCQRCVSARISRKSGSCSITFRVAISTLPLALMEFAFWYLISALYPLSLN